MGNELVIRDATLTPPQVENFRKLARGLKQLNSEYAQFSMTEFCTDEYRDYVSPVDSIFEIKNICGTAACALGHAPSFLDGDGFPRDDEDWWLYSRRVFVHEETVAFDWCFSHRWTDTDDTPAGAAYRIEYMLQHGIPQWFVTADAFWDEYDDDTGKTQDFINEQFVQNYNTFVEQRHASNVTTRFVDFDNAMKIIK